MFFIQLLPAKNSSSTPPKKVLHTQIQPPLHRVINKQTITNTDRTRSTRRETKKKLEKIKQNSNIQNEIIDPLHGKQGRKKKTIYLKSGLIWWGEGAGDGETREGTKVNESPPERWPGMGRRGWEESDPGFPPILGISRSSQYASEESRFSKSIRIPRLVPNLREI